MTAKSAEKTPKTAEKTKKTVEKAKKTAKKAKKTAAAAPAARPKRAKAAPEPKLVRSTPLQLKRLVARACKALSSRKGVDIAILDLTGKSNVCDYVILCTGMNQPHLRALVEEVAAKMRAGKPSLGAYRRCGERGNDWIALDYLEFVVHVFTPAMRAYYDIEGLWKDAPRIPWDDAPAPKPAE